MDASSGRYYIVADDTPFGVDSEGLGRSRPQQVSSGESAVVEKKAVQARGSEVEADDVPFRVDAECFGRSGAWYVNGSESAIAEQKTVVAPQRVIVLPDDIPLGIDT